MWSRCFFFSSRRRHTRWTGDWSSDVCSSDLNRVFGQRICPVRSAGMAGRRQSPAVVDVSVPNVARMYDYWLGGKDNRSEERRVGKEGRTRMWGAPCRERVESGSDEV